jgi:L-threonylcarbamoyladenylate synthase
MINYTRMLFLYLCFINKRVQSFATQRASYFMLHTHTFVKISNTRSIPVGLASLDPRCFVGLTRNCNKFHPTFIRNSQYMTFTSVRKHQQSIPTHLLQHQSRLCSARQMATETITNVSDSFTKNISQIETIMSFNNMENAESCSDDKISKTSTAMITTDIKACAERIRQGKLVAFPTETVYGLGANALNEQAVLSIFQAKERPLTDPLIVHVLHPSDAYHLWQATSTDKTETSCTIENDTEKTIIQQLCQTFWPGPLTIVAKATKQVPDVIMAGTGYCACRSPSGHIARQLLHATASLTDGTIIPIAAPSANKFGHVSPTSYQHVYDDLLYEDVWILKEAAATITNSDSTQDETTTPIICEVGVESSVVKVEQVHRNNDQTRYIVTMLRQGSVSVGDIQSCLKAAGLYSIDSDTVSVTTMTERATKEDISNVAPGQLVRHYSPNIPSFMLSLKAHSIDGSMPQETITFLNNAIIIDYGQRLKALQSIALNYRDLSRTNNSNEAAQNIFDTLRWAEQVSGAHVIIFPQIIDIEQQIPLALTTDQSCGDFVDDDALKLAIHDKLKRAASGVIVDSIEQIAHILKGKQ